MGVVKLVVRESAGALREGLGTYRHLVCHQQRMADGRLRPRNQLPSEKLFDGEDPVLAATRCTKEELGAAISDPQSNVKVYPETLVEWNEVTDSPSFPELHTFYRLIQVDTLIRGLPSDAFSTVEGKKEHFWEWRVDADDDLRRRKEPEAADEAAEAAT